MKKQKCSPNTSIINLSNAWSKRARRMLDSVPHNAPKLTVLEFYWWFWSVHGKNKYRGFHYAGEDGVARVGLKTFEEIRRCLMRNGFPDLSDEMFRPSGFCSRCCPKSLLNIVLTCWREASSSNKTFLRRKIYECDCDGH